jgi:hypothetical protein
VLRQGSPVDFTWIPARWRSFYVTVRGPLINSATGELIGDFLEEQLVRVRRGKRAPVKFDLRPKETVLEITVSGADKAAGAVALALRGVPTSATRTRAACFCICSRASTRSWWARATG